jgi:hypothetical protein
MDKVNTGKDNIKKNNNRKTTMGRQHCTGEDKNRQDNTKKDNTVQRFNAKDTNGKVNTLNDNNGQDTM